MTTNAWGEYAPSGCHWHPWLWHETVGHHHYQPPTQTQIKARMLARRATTTSRKDTR